MKNFLKKIFFTLRLALYGTDNGTSGLSQWPPRVAGAILEAYIFS